MRESANNWTSQSVSNGQQAIDLLTSAKFDLILMDCQMPVMDGYEATRIIRDTNSPVLRHDVPIIAITANISDENRDRCLKVGMDNFIPKPINREKIKTIALQVMRQKTSC
ncbi:MAG: response regulator [Desulfobacteraceae bacterium]|nr:response regulator [Desulfobacteraceae bacterium]